MTGREPDTRGRLLARIGAGLAVFVLGAALALALLPEWRAADLPGPLTFQRQYARLARDLGFALAPGRPRPVLTTPLAQFAAAYKTLGQDGAGWLERTRTGVAVEMTHGVRRPGSPHRELLTALVSLDGQPARVEWEDPEVSLFQSVDRAAFTRFGLSLARRMTQPGETLGPPRETQILGPVTVMQIDLPGSSPQQHFEVVVSPPRNTVVRRLPGPAMATGPAASLASRLLPPIVQGLVFLLTLAAIGGIFLTLLVRGRIDLVNGAILALVTLVSADLRPLFELRTSTFETLFNVLAASPGRALLVFLAWSAGESLLRAADPEFTTSLDTLRLGRLGPRGGRALLLGLGAGAALAGLHLGIHALAVIVPGISPFAPSVEVPVFSPYSSPVGSGILLAAGIALALALARRFLPAGWTVGAAALVAGVALAPFELIPFPVELAVNVGVAALLVWLCRRHGLTALLIACVVSLLLPALLFSALHARWMPGVLAVTAGLTLAIAVQGLVGLSRPEGIETGSVPTPAFVRRLAEERRLRHEVDLLARMQVGLLPREMPRVPGWEIAARSVLASEAGGDLYDFLRDDAGGLWIAAGDVAGHGYSCAILQAMVKAGLVSLVAPEETPGRVLSQLDRVLRSAAIEQSFTSLALVRLDPATGEAQLGNAGHPYALVFTRGEVEELDLPGLPLGQGPLRTYPDRAFDLPSGSVLLLCSDGLFEALDRNGNAYGFERGREVLKVMGHRPPLEIVDALLNDCRRHLGAEEPPDDVTVVAVKRG